MLIAFACFFFITNSSFIWQLRDISAGSTALKTGKSQICHGISVHCCCIAQGKTCTLCGVVCPPFASFVITLQTMVVTDVSQLAIHLLRGGLCPLTFSQVADTRARVEGRKVESPFAKMKNILSTVSFAAACFMLFGSSHTCSNISTC